MRNNMGLSKDINELKEAGVISEETADEIRAYYQRQQSASSNRLFMVFGVLGAMLVGLGIILIIAHNWDNLSRSVKTIIAFVPLVAGQILCGYSRFIKKDSQVWKESSAMFLCLAIAACISLISQIYHIPGNLSGFLLIWMLLSLPLIYIMDASIVSLLCIVGITWYACETSYWHYPNSTTYPYWGLMLFVLPHYLSLFKAKPDSNTLFFHHWLVPLSLIIVLGTLTKDHGALMYLAYMSLFGLFYQLGITDQLAREITARNGFKITGVIGMITLLMTFSFDAFWEDLLKEEWNLRALLLAPEFWAGLLLTVSTLAMQLRRVAKQAPDTKLDFISWIFLVYAVLFVIGLFTMLPVVLINVILFALGIYKIWEGNRRDHLGVMNFGLLIIIALVICRFFDTELSFVARGILFIVVGSGCFLANYQLLKRRKPYE